MSEIELLKSILATLMRIEEILRNTEDTGKRSGVPTGVHDTSEPFPAYKARMIAAGHIKEPQ